MATYCVGILTYNRPDHLSRLLNSLDAQTATPDQVIVVDDGDSEAVRGAVATHRDRMAEHDTDVRYEVGNPETAQPGSRNQILEATDCDVVCYLDDDEVCDPAWFEHVRKGFREYPEAVGVGGPAILADEDLEPIVPEILTDRENQNELTRFGEFRFLTEYWIPPEPVETELLGGGNMAFRTDELRRIGGFDTAYSGGPAYYEETDLMARFFRENATLLYHPGAKVFHLDADAGGARSSDAEYWFAKHTILYIKQNFPDTYYRALRRILFGRQGYPPSIARALVRSVTKADASNLSIVRGYLAGLYEY